MTTAWLPGVTRVPYLDAGAMLNAPARGVIHTTQGTSLPHYSGSAPHITHDLATGKRWQHIALNRCALALEHNGGIDTNRMNAIQVENIGFAIPAGGDDWPDIYYEHLAALMRDLEAATGIKPTCDVTFTAAWHGMSDSKWRTYNGWCGHQNVPHQERMRHWDPGVIHIDKLLAGHAHSASDYPGHVIDHTSHGGNVKTVQRWLNDVRNPDVQPLLKVDGAYGSATEKRVRQFQAHHHLQVDGIVGSQTWAALRKAARAK